MPLTEDEIMLQLMSTFKAEADDHLTSLTSLLLRLEKADEDGAELLEEIFRAAHSLKGAARAVEIECIETTSHGMENVFAAAKRGDLTLTPGHYDLLYKAIDKISSCLTALAAGEPAPEADEALLGRLEESVTAVETDNQPALAEATGQAKPKAKKSSGAVEDMVRVSTRKLDGLMTHVEELLVSKIRGEQRVAELKEIKTALQNWQKSWFKVRGTYDKQRRQPQQEITDLVAFLGENQDNLKWFWTQTNQLLQEFSKDSLRMSLITEDLQEDILRVRMMPVASVFDSYHRVVRDLARAQKKKVNLVVSGSTVELDKKLIEGIKDPLMHIIRNAVDHGIEEPTVRKAAGKPETGTVWLRASQQGNTIQVEVEDDGGGIDLGRIVQVAIDKGIIASQQAKGLSDEDIRLLIFQSGFSTAVNITNVSGRGVGMDVVKTNIEKLNGLVHISPRAGGGTRFAFSLPLTLSTSRVLLVKAGGETFAIPTTSVERIVRVDRSEIFTVGSSAAIRIAGRSLSLVNVADVLELDGATDDAEASKIPVIILGAAERRVAFSIDSLLGETEIVIKTLGKMMSRVRNVSGATILGNGQVVMILNVSDMIKSAKSARHRIFTSEVETHSASVHDLNKGRISVLIVDDSITTRIMEKNILESAGYNVALANDGMEAYEALKLNQFDLLISDVDMPRMNGFELTAKVKQSHELKDLPIVLVTSLDSSADRERGLECGADAYIIKHSFDQKNLLETIEQLV